MSNKLFIGGLSWDTNDEGLKAAFEPFGQITEAKVILDRDTGRSRGFGFVTFDDPAAAQRAIEEKDGTEIDGRTVRVNEAAERAPRGGGGGGGGGGRFGADAPRGGFGKGRGGGRGRRNSNTGGDRW